MSTTIRETRKKRGLTLMALAHEVGSSPAWLHYVERYGHVPGAELRARIAAALSVDEVELWPERGNSDSPDGVKTGGDRNAD
jgi:transcriptional regulator with XRE-family HTH domain